MTHTVNKYVDTYLCPSVINEKYYIKEKEIYDKGKASKNIAQPFFYLHFVFTSVSSNIKSRTERIYI